jgi:hypothetical protein
VGAGEKEKRTGLGIFPFKGVGGCERISVVTWHLIGCFAKGVEGCAEAGGCVRKGVDECVRVVISVVAWYLMCQCLSVLSALFTVLDSDEGNFSCWCDNAL